ncbi:2-oxo acid dehydrogenase subunit E2 [Rhodococcus fascians]|nr:2-oxo acid dehydrogenase subunit E2 [Rhodococcus fascians]
MSSPRQFALPDVGEGLTEADITKWFVSVGDVVAVNDTLVEIETAKSAVELPSPFAGVVRSLLAGEGDTVDVGTPIIEIGDPLDVIDSAPTPTAEQAPAPTPELDAPEDEDTPQVLVGPGPKEAAARSRRLAPRTSGSAVRAAPPTRLRAKELGVDLDALATSDGSIITSTDVEAMARVEAVSDAVSPTTQIFSAQQPTGSEPRETRTPVRGVRKMTAEAMTRSAFTAPHVTEWLTVDVTPTMRLLDHVRSDRAWTGVRVTPLVLVARAFLLAIRSFPDVNATWDNETDEIVVKHYVNLGIAAATPRGLIVPNIKNAHEMDVRTLANALVDLVTVARSGKTPPADMARGTVTITNLGSLGVDAGTPILNPGEAAILAFGAVREQPWVVNGSIEIRQVTQLAMSFDHRLVDGELGSNVLARTGEILSNPGNTLLYA